MRSFPRVIRLLCAGGFLAAVACGCSSLEILQRMRKPPPEQAVMLEPPKIETEQDIGEDPTLLEKYKAATRAAEEEMARAGELTAELKTEKTALRTTQQELGAVKEANVLLEKRAAAFDKLAKDYEKAQHQLLSLTSDSRGLRQELLKERLTRVKLEQTILTLKIDIAKAKRRELLNRSAYKQSAGAKEENQ